MTDWLIKLHSHSGTIQKEFSETLQILEMSGARVVLRLQLNVPHPSSSTVLSAGEKRFSQVSSCTRRNIVSVIELDQFSAPCRR